MYWSVFVTSVRREKFLPEDLDIIVEKSIRPLPKNNEMQQKAISRGLTDPFTLIQGPPGIIITIKQY